MRCGVSWDRFLHKLARHNSAAMLWRCQLDSSTAVVQLFAARNMAPQTATLSTSFR